MLVDIIHELKDMHNEEEKSVKLKRDKNSFQKKGLKQNIKTKELPKKENKNPKLLILG